MRRPGGERLGRRLHRGNAFAQRIRGRVRVMARARGQRRRIEPFDDVGEQRLEPFRPLVTAGVVKRDQRIGERRR